MDLLQLPFVVVAFTSLPSPVPSRHPRPERVAVRVALASLVLVGVLAHFTGLTAWADRRLIDARFTILRTLGPAPVPDDIRVIGIDAESFARHPEPLALWHRHIAAMLDALAAAGPRTVVLDVALPDRSFDAYAPGGDQALAEAIGRVRTAAPLFLAVTVDERTGNRVVPHAPFVVAAGADRLGYALFQADPDGVVRRFTDRLGVDGERVPTLVGLASTRDGREAGTGIVDFAAGSKFDYFPFHHVADARSEDLRSRFSGRIVLVGSVAAFEDRHTLPVALAAWETAVDSPGVLLHAQALRSVLHSRLIDLAPAWAVLVAIVLPAVFIGVLRRNEHTGAVALASAAALVLVSLGLLHLGIELPVSAALAVTLLGLTAAGSISARAAAREQARLQALFGGYVSPRVFDAIVAGELAVDEPRRVDLAILYADLRGFSAMTRTEAPATLYATMSEYFNAIAGEIHRHGGTIDNFRGDAVLAFFGAPAALDDPAAAAFAAATGIDAALHRLNLRRSEAGGPPLAAGIALAYGEATVGYVGSRDRRVYTVLGEPANRAAHIQDLCRPLGAPLLADPELVARLGSAGWESLGEQVLKDGRRCIVHRPIGIGAGSDWRPTPPGG